MPAVYNHSLEFCLYIGISCNGRRVQPKQETATPGARTNSGGSPDRQAVGGESTRQTPPARETLQAAAPNKRKPAHGGGEPDKRQQAGQCVYIMLYYVNAFASRRAYVLPRQCSRAVGRGWFFRTGCAIEKRKRPVLIPPCTRSLVNT